jgi:hypothetical protein
VINKPVVNRMLNGSRVVGPAFSNGNFDIPAHNLTPNHFPHH